MKSFVAIFGLAVLGAAAQDTVISPAVAPPQKVVFFSSPVMGKAVKGAPYSATEVTESSQVLGDGTNISHKSEETVYRDGEGRVRRESPDRITIFDPVAGESYTLNPKSMTAVKSSMGTVVPDGGRGAADRTAATGYSYTVTSDATPRALTVTAPSAANGAADDVKAAAMLDKLTAEMKAQLDQTQAKLVAAKKSSRAAVENLGQKVIEGVTAEGTRTTETIEAGEIGNDRPIKVVNERWVSADLKTLVMTVHSDPRTGQETFRLTNVQRGEPGYDLFMLPPGYQVVGPSWTVDGKKKLEQEQQ